MKKMAVTYLGQERVENELPDVIVYEPRGSTYLFKLKRSEQTPHWIRLKDAGRSRCEFASSNRNFEVLYSDGALIKIWAGEEMPSGKKEDFKIRARRDVMINMKVVGP